MAKDRNTGWECPERPCALGDIVSAKAFSCRSGRIFEREKCNQGVRPTLGSEEFGLDEEQIKKYVTWQMNRDRNTEQPK
jgi:hypothetical protein